MVMRHLSRHISLDRLVDLARGHLTAAEQQSIHAHTASCADCASQMARIARLIAVTSADDSEDAPAHVADRAVRLMRQRNAALSAMRPRLTAALRFDSRRMPVALGARGQAAGARQIMFETEQHNVDVRIKPVGAQWAVWGQVLGAVAGGQAELQGLATVQADLNHLSEFDLPPVPPGAYTLILRLDDLEIDMALNIGE
jgi:anti-sigma factor RsiW